MTGLLWGVQSLNLRVIEAVLESISREVPPYTATNRLFVAYAVQVGNGQVSEPSFTLAEYPILQVYHGWSVDRNRLTLSIAERKLRNFLPVSKSALSESLQQFFTWGSSPGITRVILAWQKVSRRNVNRYAMANASNGKDYVPFGIYSPRNLQNRSRLLFIERKLITHYTQLFISYTGVPDESSKGESRKSHTPPSLPLFAFLSGFPFVIYGLAWWKGVYYHPKGLRGFILAGVSLVFGIIVMTIGINGLLDWSLSF